VDDAAQPADVTPSRYRKRGRPAKDLNVIDGGFAGAPKRPDPFADMNKRQKAIWRDIVSSEPVDFFSTHAVRAMLRDLCSHREAIEGLNAIIETFKPAWIRAAEGAKRYRELLRMRQDETRAASLLATRLRLTNQSRYTPQAAATASRNTSKVRPWEEQD